MMVCMNDQVEAILAKTTLENEDKELWREYLKWAPPFFTERFVELFKDNVSDLPDATVNLRQKISGSDDHELQQVILEQELKSLQAYFNNKE